MPSFNGKNHTWEPSNSEPFPCQDNGQCGKFHLQWTLNRNALKAWLTSQSRDQMASRQWRVSSSFWKKRIVEKTKMSLLTKYKMQSLCAGWNHNKNAVHTLNTDFFQSSNLQYRTRKCSLTSNYLISSNILLRAKNLVGFTYGEVHVSVNKKVALISWQTTK